MTIKISESLHSRLEKHLSPEVCENILMLVEKRAKWLLVLEYDEEQDWRWDEVEIAKLDEYETYGFKFNEVPLFVLSANKHRSLNWVLSGRKERDDTDQEFYEWKTVIPCTDKKAVQKLHQQKIYEATCRIVNKKSSIRNLDFAVGACGRAAEEHHADMHSDFATMYTKHKLDELQRHRKDTINTIEHQNKVLAKLNEEIKAKGDTK